MKKASILLVFCALIFASCTRINPTEAGFKIENSGNYRGMDTLPFLTGWQFYMPGFSRIITIPTVMQHEVWTDSKTEGQEGDQAISIACEGGAGFRVDVGLNYHVDPNKAAHIYLKWKDDDIDDITNKYIKNVIRGCMQDVSGHITVDSVLNNIPAFEHETASLIKQRLGVDGFIVDGFNIVSQPRPTDPSLSASINNKIKAKQDAETSIMELQKSIAEANKKMADARGDSASKVIKAAGEAEAVKKIQTVLSAEYVEYIKAQQWDGKLPSVTGGNGGMILSLANPK